MSTLLILHLSDIHIEDQNCPVLQRHEVIAAALQPLLPRAENVVVAVTGDISQSGKAEEFVHAERWLRQLAGNLRSRKGADPFMLLVPGNHDANLKHPRAAVRKALLNSLRNDGLNEVDSALVKECTVIFEEYHSFARLFHSAGLTDVSEVWSKAVLTVGEHVIEFHLVNNAWACDLHTEPGTLGFPIDRHVSSDDGAAAVRILLTHHPFHWLQQNHYREFRRLVRDSAEICFTGHEHEMNVGSVSDLETGHTVFIEGSALHEKSRPSASGFTATLIDLGERSVETWRFAWSGGFYAMAPESFRQDLPVRRNLPGLERTFGDFIEDLGSNVSHHAKDRLLLSDIYVYPDVSGGFDEEADPVVISARQLIETADGERVRLLIKGDQSSGKTALLKRFYVHLLEQGRFPLYLNLGRLKGPSRREVFDFLEGAIAEQYNSVSRGAFNRSEPSRRTLLIDNVDRYTFPAKYFNSVAGFFADFSRDLIFTSESSFDLHEAFFSDEFAALRECAEWEILELSVKLRRQLVDRWFSIADRSRTAADYESSVEQAQKVISATLGKGLVPSHPIYLLVLLQGIEVGRVGDLENSALGYYYEYMILEALGPRVRREQVDEVLNYCSEFAWFLSAQGIERVDDKAFRLFHSAFEEKYDLAIRYDVRRDILESSNLLSELKGGIGFRYPYGYYFFLGRYMSKNLRDQEVQSYIRQCSEALHVRDRANAMLFLAHHANDLSVLELIQEAVRAKFSTVVPIRLEGDTAKLDQLVEQAPRLMVSHRTRETEVVAEEERQVRIEQKLDEVVLSTASQSDTSDEQRRTFQLLADINGLVKGIEILGVILKANVGSIPSQSKQAAIREIIQGNLRALRVFVELLADAPEYLLSELEEALESLPSEQSAAVERAVRIRVFRVLSRFSFWFIRKAAVSLGTKGLTPALDRYSSENTSIAERLVVLASRMELPGSMPIEALREAVDLVRGTAFGQSILRLMAINRVYMFPSAEVEKQQLWAELGIDVGAMHAIDYKSRQQKRAS